MSSQLVLLVSPETAEYFNDRCRYLGVERTARPDCPAERKSRSAFLRHMVTCYLKHLRYSWPENKPYPAAHNEIPERTVTLMCLKVPKGARAEWASAISDRLVVDRQQLCRLAIEHDRQMRQQQAVRTQQLMAKAAAAETEESLYDLIDEVTGRNLRPRLESGIPAQVRAA